MTDSDPAERPDDEPRDRGVVDRARTVLGENGPGMLGDLAFAVAWVGVASLVYGLLFPTAPQWVLYMLMIAGIPAYFGFFVSLDAARERQRE
jgi:hypothetical protein